MGQSQSQNNYKRSYSTQEVRDMINKTLLNPLNHADYGHNTTMGELPSTRSPVGGSSCGDNNMEQDMGNEQMGEDLFGENLLGGFNFNSEPYLKSRRNRYSALENELDQLLQGGGAAGEESEYLSDFSELNRIKNLIRNSIESSKQTGGDLDANAVSLTGFLEGDIGQTPASPAQNDGSAAGIRALLYAMNIAKRGNQEGGANGNESDVDSDDMDVDKEETSEPMDVDEEETSDVIDVDKEETSDDMDVDMSDSEDDGQKSEPMDVEESDEGVDNRDDAAEGFYSETSFESRQSDVNILPFYSSTSSSTYSFQHPYVKNRFD